MSSSRSNSPSIILPAILACLLWSTAFVVAKKALAFQRPLHLAGMRFLLAGLLQLAFCGGPSAPFRLIRDEFGTVLLVSLFHTVYLYGTFFLALEWVPAAEAAIMIGAGPLVSAFVAHLMMAEDRLERRTVLSALFGLAGVTALTLASKPWSPRGDVRELLGLLLLLSGSFVSALGNVIVAKRKGALHPVALNSAQMLLGGPLLLLIALPFEGLPRLLLPASFYSLLLWLALISAVGFAIWFHLLARVRVSRLNLWKFLIPLNGALLSWLLMPGESPTAPALIGMALILAGIAFGQTAASRQ